jgi:hypothetical protein
MSDDFDDLMDEAIDNIRNDRKAAREFLNELANQIAQNAENNRALSPVAAKHIETMQRSNEQLVKVLALKHKERNKDVGQLKTLLISPHLLILALHLIYFQTP